MKAIIEIFYEFDFFALDRYFKRLNDLTMRFKKAANQEEIEIIEKARKRLHEEAKAKTADDDTPPPCLGELPVTVQRKLARNGEYPEYFCASSNNMVADEVFRYINYNNVGRYISLSSINKNLFLKILQKLELFRNNSVVTAALNHPKCTTAFAAAHASRINKIELKKIVSNPNADGGVRGFIKTRFKL